MPLRDIFRRRRAEVAAPAEATAAAPAPSPGALLDGYTEDWHLRGRVRLEGRLLDALDRREPLAIEAVEWAPTDGSSGFEPAPGLQTVDPYDLVLVLAGQETMPARTIDEVAAHRRTREHFGVLLHLPPFRVAGVVYLHPGTEPSSLLDRAAGLFFAVTDADAAVGEVRIGPAAPTTILANRSYLTRVEQIDRAYSEPAESGEETGDMIGPAVTPGAAADDTGGVAPA